jgi:hypothetical protein
MEGIEPAVGTRTVSLLNDDPNALKFLCDIAHLWFNLLPKQISLEDLFDIAVVSDKYDMISKAKPIIKHQFNFHRKVMSSGDSSDSQ